MTAAEETPADRTPLPGIAEPPRRLKLGLGAIVALVLLALAVTIGIGVCVAVGWAASTITASRERIRQADEQVRQLNDRAEATRQESDKLKAQVAQERQQMSDKLAAAQKDAEQARNSGARAEGQLAAYIEQSHKRPTTQPRTLAQRIASALAEPD